MLYFVKDELIKVVDCDKLKTTTPTLQEKLKAELLKLSREHLKGHQASLVTMV